MDNKKVDYVKWANQQIDKVAEPRGRTEVVVALAKRLGMTKATLYKRLEGKVEFSPSEIDVMAEYFGIDSPVKSSRNSRPQDISGNVISMHNQQVPISDTSVLYPVLGVVDAGSFKDADLLSQAEPQTIRHGRSSRYPNARPMAWIVRGDSMNATVPFPILDGMIVLGVDFQEAGGILTNNMIVVVERNRGGLVERSVKAVAVFPDRTEFQPRSTDARHKPIVYRNGDDDDAEVRVLTIVHVAYGDLSI